ncbi:hypothetical protein [Pedobacter foliorum]|uniref:hypothetical protein n=1 Tax=Pedobacter foliorum TaxID=2739058 RepID=UPI001565ED29|nr:hypothetical protein [Pedobacter foliorum]NRF40210.1 hypothetical protein [Pedobacter foliorum]
MKTKILVLFILPLLIACKKKEMEKDMISIVGKWELRTVINGLTGQKTDYPNGNGNIIVFTKSNYQNYSGQKLIKSGTYKIVKEISAITNVMGNRIIYDDETDAVRLFIDTHDGNLNLNIDAIDGSGTIYKGIENNN